MGESGDLVCGYCGRSESFSAPVSVCLVFMTGLKRPYALIPANDYRVCQGCDAVFNFVERSVSAHPKTREGGSWTRAVLVFSDGRGADIKATRKETAQA